MGKRKKNETLTWGVPDQVIVCPVCNREVPKTQLDKHHLVPKSKGGRDTVEMHRACHRQIHMLFTESELARQFDTIEKVLENPSMQNFVLWIKDKPNDFLPSMRQSSRTKK